MVFNRDIEFETITEIERSALITTKNRLNLIHSRQLITNLKRLIFRGYKTFIIDLRNTTTIDDTGLGSLAWCYEEVSAIQGTFQLICTDSASLQLLQLSGITDFAQPAKDLPDVLKKLGNTE